MKTLFVIRHATSEEASGNDYDRSISNLGRRECYSVGQYLKNSGVFPDIILSSSASRAIQTARHLSQILGVEASRIEMTQAWYLAPAVTWFTAIQQLAESASTVFIVGHNPGIAEVVLRMVNQSISPFSFPPLSFAHLEFDFEFWGNIEWRTGRLVRLKDPSSI